MKKRPIAGLLGAAALVALTTPAIAQPADVLTRPRIRTTTPDRVASVVFDPGERVVVLGTGFPPRGRVAVTFEQEARAELGAVRVDDSGNFAASLRVIDDAVRGPATVRASSGEVSVTAALGIGRGEADADGESLVALLPWAVALLIVSEAFAWAVWRPGRVTREAGRQRGTRRRDEGSAPDAEPEPEEVEPSSAAVRRLRDDIRFWTRKP